MKKKSIYPQWGKVLFRRRIHQSTQSISQLSKRAETGRPKEVYRECSGGYSGKKEY
jgi:hypothetical protein